jgi:hypothetical protein
MSKDEYQADSRLRNVDNTEDASTSKDADKLVKVKKVDSAEDKENKFVIHEKPSDEQINKSFDDLRENPQDEEAE